MNLAANIRSIYRENGNLVSMLDENIRVISEEFIQIEDPALSNSSSEDALYSHSVRRGSVAADTEITIGSLLNFDERNWFVADRNALLQQEEIYEYSFLMFQINSIGRLVRLSEARDMTTYENKITETVLTENAYGFMDIPQLTYQKKGTGVVISTDAKLYLPERYGVKPGDRFIISDTEKYQILMVKTRVIQGIVITSISNDFRADITNVSS